MFKKLKSSLGGAKARQKVRLDVTVQGLEGLPAEVAQCRVVWARQAKVSVTKIVAANQGKVAFNEELSQIATLTRDARGGFDSKEYQFKVQAPERGNQQKYVTLGKAVLDMARFTGDSPSRPQSLKLKIPLARHPNATLSVLVATSLVKGFDDDDDMTSVATGMSGLSAIEQDLSGFDGDSRRPSTGVVTPLQRVTEESETVNGTGKDREGQNATMRQLEEQLASAKRTSAEMHRVGNGSATPSQATELSQETSSLKQEHDLKSQGPPAPNAQRQVEALQQQNKQLEEQVQALKAAAAVSTAAAGAGAALAASGGSDAGVQLGAAQRRVAELEEQLALQLEKSDSAIVNGTDNIQKLQTELQAAQSTIAALEQELTEVKSMAQLSQQNSAANMVAGSGVTPEVAAKLALYESKIEQLMHLVEEQDRPQSDREAELEARLREAEEHLAALETGGAEAENMATEALNLLEAAQSENMHLHDQLNQLRMDMEWQQKKAVKDRADWEARMQDGFRRVEESVIMAERLQKDKDEMQARYDLLMSERNSLEAQLDPEARDQQVAAESERARVAAEQQARIEVELLQSRIREMEEFVEKADAARLEMAAKVSGLAAQLAAVKREEQDSFDQVKSAEERADGLMLELQYLQAEKERLQGELGLVREEHERAAAAVAKEAAVQESRAAALAQQLDEAKAQLRQAEAERGALHSKQIMLEENLESSRLQAVELQQKLSMAAAAGAAAGVAGAAVAASAGPNDELQALHDMEERRRAADERAAQLDATSRELADVRASLQVSKAECDSLRAALEEAHRTGAATQSRVQLLEESARAREVQAAQMEQLQHDMAAAMLAAKEHNSSAASLGQHKAALESQLAEVQAAHSSEVGALSQQLDEAQALADFSSRELAGVVQQLARVEAERADLESKVSELRDDLLRLRAGNDGELRMRIEKLEKELLVARNARDVNALFKTEHDRIATELIETKLLWAEAQEQIVKLKQALVKSQEKSISFAAKLTRLETKLYKRLKPDKEAKEKKKADKAAAAAARG